MPITSRIVSDDIWSDDLFAALTLPEKLVTLYLDTNPYVTMCGLYKLSLRKAAFELTIADRELLEIIGQLEKREILIVRGSNRMHFPRAIYDSEFIFVPGMEIRLKATQLPSYRGHVGKTERDTRVHTNRAVIAFRDYFHEQLSQPIHGKDGMAPCDLFTAIEYFREYEYNGVRCPEPEFNAKQWWEFNNDRRWSWAKNGEKIASWQGNAENRILEMLKQAAARESAREARGSNQSTDRNAVIF